MTLIDGGVLLQKKSLKRGSLFKRGVLKKGNAKQLNEP